jgi:signal transduction histidine kinase
VGTAYVRLDDHEKAMTNLNQSLAISERMGDKSLAFKVHNAIAVIYKNIYQNEKALEHYFKAIDMAGELGDTASFALIYNGIGVVYTKLDSMDTAEKYFRQSLEIAEKTNNARVMSFQYRNLGIINFENENYPEAERLYNQALDLRMKQNDQLAIGGSYFDLGEVYLATNRIKKAEVSFAKALEIFQNLGALSSENSTYEKIAELYQKKNDFRNALFYKNKYYSTRDSLKDNELREKINEIDTKYETSKKELEIERQQQEINKKTYQRNLLLSVLSLIVLLAATLIWGIWSRMKRNRKITQQEKAIQQEKIKSLEKEKKLLSFASILEGQESERIRIAKDLHDGLGGLLTNVKAHFGRIQVEIKKVEELDVYNSACDMIDKAHEEVRRISHNLMPGDLRAGGLPMAISKIVSELSAHAVKIELDTLGFNGKRIDEKIELASYRIIQELLNNAIKHSGASNIMVQISKFETELNMVVEDDGKGFNYHEVILRDGLGLKSIQSRVEQLNGTIDIDASPGKGTSVSINLPLKPAS